jgi:hypothetical protein
VTDHSPVVRRMVYDDNRVFVGWIARNYLMDEVAAFDTDDKFVAWATNERVARDALATRHAERTES